MRLTKEQKNKIVDIAIEKQTRYYGIAIEKQTRYYGMCSCLLHAIQEYCNIPNNDPERNAIARDILHKKFPRFNRENFIRFVENNYPNDIKDVMFCKKTEDVFWIAIHPDKDHIRIAYLNNLKQ